DGRGRPVPLPRQAGGPEPGRLQAGQRPVKRLVRMPRWPRPPRLCNHEIASPRVTAELDGIRIGQLSDIHVRVGLKPRRLHQAVEMLNALAPDLVALTGDYLCFSSLPLRQLTDALKRLVVPAYAVLGNHDHFCGA